MSTKPILQLIAKDSVKQDHDWRWLAVLHFTGELAMDPETPHCVSQEQIREVFQFLESYQIFVQPGIERGAGQPFAREPFMEWFPNHIVITQSGGLDV